jgi:uncharacterized membrane protein YoaK (UPF0700 family)
MMVGNLLWFAVSAACLIHDATNPERPVALYFTAVVLFMAGAAVYYTMQRQLGSTPRAFIPLVLLSFVGSDLLVAYEASYGPDCPWEGWTVLALPFVFGITSAMSMNSGVGVMPFPTTTSMVNLAYTLAKVASGKGCREEFNKSKKHATLFTFFVLGAITGQLYELVFDMVLPGQCTKHLLQEQTHRVVGSCTQQWILHPHFVILAPFLSYLLWINDRTFAEDPSPSSLDHKPTSVVDEVPKTSPAVEP